MNGKRSGLEVVCGRPGIAAGGARLTAMYSETHPVRMHEHNAQMARAGVEVFILIVRGGHGDDYNATYFWRGDGIYGDESDRHDGLELNRQAAEILALKPDAHFMVRWASAVPRAWAARHPDELQAGETRRLDRASYASRLAAQARAEQARRIVTYCEAQPWGGRVIGYLPFGQDEGTSELNLFHAMFDQAPVMQQAFRAWLKKKYGSDRELRRAWGIAGATLDGARVPTDTEWQAARRNWMHWPEPAQLRRFQDYFLLQRELQMFQRRNELAAVRRAAGRAVVTATDSYKLPMLGWLHNDAFHASATGMDWRNVLLASGCFDAAEALDMPELDALITPADYTARSNGWGWEAEGIGDSLVLRGKTIFIEDDARSWATDERTTQGAWRNVDECRAGLLRNLAIAASRGHFPYWMNVGGGYFDDPDVLRVVAEQVPVRRRLLTRPLVRTEHAIAMIIDDTGPLDEDFTSGFQNLAVLRQRNDHLCNTGIPWRIFLFGDLERDDFPVYRTYLLPNCFRLTERKAELIRRKLMRNGSVVIFGPATGITDGHALGAEAASGLLGFPLELVRKETARRVLVYGGSEQAAGSRPSLGYHPALADMRGPVTYGDSYVYGPVLEPAADLARSGAVELGKASTWWHSNRAGLVLKEFGRGAAGNGVAGERAAGDCAIVFSVAVPIPAELLRSLAIYGGCTAWSDLGDVVAANGSMLAVHSVRPGRRTLHLPRPARIIDAVSGEIVATKADSFDVVLKSPDTRVFLLE